MVTNEFFDTDLPSDAVADAPIVPLDSARERDPIRDLSVAHGGETLLTLFAESRLLFGLRGSLSVDDPCPRCVLFHLASDPAQVSSVREETPPESSPPSIGRETLEELATGSKRTHPEPSLVAYDSEADSWFDSAPVHKHPLCSHRGFAEKSTTTPRTVADASDFEATFLDPHFGFVRRATVTQSTPTGEMDFPEFYTVHSQVINPAYYRYPNRFERFVEAGGAGQSPEMARVRGLMEGIERFATLLPRSVERVASETSLDEPYVSLSSFHTYDESQYADPNHSYARYDESTACEWVTARKLGTDESVSVPADVVYVTPPERTDRRFVPASSNGCAAHLDLSEAYVAGVTELFERDAVMHHWYARSAKPHVRARTLPDSCRERLSELESAGYDVRIIDATRHAPFYCFEVFCLDPDAEPLPNVVPGIACALDTETAIEAAFREVLDVLSAGIANDVSPIESKTDVETTEDHFRFYQRAGRHEQVDEFLESGETVDFQRKSADASVSAVARAAAERDVALYATELTPPSLRRHGVHVVRTLSPDLVPITFGHGNERLAHPSKPVPDNRPTEIPHPIP